jgi:hypothetical protein
MNAFGSSRSPFGQSLFGGSNNQSQQPQQQMQNPFMQSSGGGFGGGFGQPQMPAYAQVYMNNMGGFGGNQGFGGGFNPMQGGYGGQMQNPFMAINQGGFGEGYNPNQMQNPFMGGMGFGGQPQRPMGGGQMMVGMGGTAENGYMSPSGFGGFGMEQPAAMYNGQHVTYGDGFGGTQYPSNQFGLMGGRARPYMGGGNNSFTPFPTTPDQYLAQDQEFLGYQKQGEDLSRQMNEYMQKAPMYQQLQDLQGKMRGVQNRYNTSVTPLPSPQRVRPEPVADMTRGPIYPNQQAPKQSYEDYINGPMPMALGYKRKTREEFDADEMQNEQRQKAGVYGLGMPQGGLQGGLGGLLGLANSGGFGRNMQPNLNNFTAPYRGAPQRPSYDEYFASRRGSMTHQMMPSREDYENPVQRLVYPANFG